MNAMTKACAQARGDDVASLRDEGLSYAASLMPNRVLTPTILAKAQKSTTRGFLHPQLGALLCPIHLYEDYMRDRDDTRAKLRDGTITVSSTQFPSFLYEDPTQYRGILDEGFCMGPFLISTFRHLFIGPQSALRKKGSVVQVKRGQAESNGLTTATARTIAYAALQVSELYDTVITLQICMTQARWNLSNVDDWRIEDPYFDRTEFFDAIVDVLNEEIIEEFSKIAFNGIAERVPDKPASTSGPDHRALILAQRRQRAEQAALAVRHMSDSDSKSSTLIYLFANNNIVFRYHQRAP
ncbi:hypothetical protein BGW80DRAFT_1377886 [Lactifluus volemus]|nr:hypothetical protein BGW80DRAFT_1400391 [Lactifluus volemus]KAH9954818.1 hypothetical protein BGW80DRAFT_1398676 [Lactifluus volemus]KAH9957990.1 hypothetical protein BGW80DRAFT_1377886 [Lactifluus volemus]